MSDEYEDPIALQLLTPLDLVKRLLTLVRRSLRYWPVFLGAMLVAGAAAALTPKLLPPMYKSQTTLVYQELIQASSLLGQDTPVESPQQRGSRLREMLTSRTNLETVINELQIYQSAVESFGIIEAVEEFRQDMQIDVGEDSFAITYESEDPERSFAVTKRLAESLIEQAGKYRQQGAMSTQTFLKAQAARTKGELDDREQALAEFLALHPEFAQDVMNPGGGTAGASIRAMGLRNRTGAKPAAARPRLPPAIEALQRQRARINARLEEKPPPPPPAPAPAEMDPAMREAIDRAQRDVDRAQSEVAAARSKYTDQHPDVQAALRRLNSAKAGLAAAKSQAAASVKAPPPAPVAPVGPMTEEEKEKLKQQLAQIDMNLQRERDKGEGATVILDEKTQKSSNWIVDLETEWAGLNRDVSDVRERYQQIQHRFFQANIMAKVEASGGAAQMVVVDPAFKPKRPYRRGPRRTAAGAAFIVMFLGGLMALFLAYFDDRVYDDRDLRELKLGKLAHTIPAAPTAKA
ncbi:MAG: hypothetical protein AAGN82_10245 [Myxococcota bacterium]